MSGQYVCFLQVSSLVRVPFAAISLVVNSELKYVNHLISDRALFVIKRSMDCFLIHLLNLIQRWYCREDNQLQFKNVKPHEDFEIQEAVILMTAHFFI